MTKEEALQKLEFERKWLSDAGYNAYNVDIAFDSIRTIIKVLCGDEPILDKIKAEIEQVKSIMNEEIINNNRKDLINFVNGLNQSLIIIDKYKAESEGGVCKDCYYNDGEVHAECVICDKAESEK